MKSIGPAMSSERAVELTPLLVYCLYIRLYYQYILTSSQDRYLPITKENTSKTSQINSFTT